MYDFGRRFGRRASDRMSRGRRAADFCGIGNSCGNIAPLSPLYWAGENLTPFAKEFKAFSPALFDWSGAAADYINARADVIENENEFQFVFEIPGVKFEDLNVSVNGRFLEVSGKQRAHNKADSDTVHMEERSWSTYYRRFALPENCDADSLSAEYADGLLTVTVPKKPDNKSFVRKVEVKK